MCNCGDFCDGVVHLDAVTMLDMQVLIRIAFACLANEEPVHIRRAQALFRVIQESGASL